MMTVYSTTALKIYPPFQVYTNFTTLTCVNDDGSLLASTDDIEWLYSNFTPMISTPDYRIWGITHIYVAKLDCFRSAAC